ncbi:peptidoglycan D,D-transpeptidase FtsI family protein [Rubidibacter lacunae]|nr:penicillin-binding protein 2 [Rubidibacter lacunae]
MSSLSRRKQQRVRKQQTRRLLVVWLILLLASFALGTRAYWLQIASLQTSGGGKPSLPERARAQRTVPLPPYIPRRAIVDRRGSVLASDRVVYTLYAHPEMFPRLESLVDTSDDAGSDGGAALVDDAAAVADRIAPWLDNYTADELAERFRQQDTGIRVADNLTEDVARAIADARLSGIDLERTYARYYPQHDLAAGIVGYVQRDERSGQAGVEYAREELLSRQGDPLRVQQAGNGQLLPRSLPDNAVQFDDSRLQLTLDLRLQRAAREALRAQMEVFAAKRGTVIVMDVHTGALVALVSEPSFNPNRYFAHELEELQNWAIGDLFEPGSTFKPINVAIALEAGAIEPGTVVYDPGRVTIGGWPISNHDFYSRGGNGSINVAKVLQVSSNVGMIHIMQKLSPRQYYKALLNLGMEKPVGVDLLGETPGHIKSEFQFLNYPIEPATAAFGQGISLTSLKLAQLHATIANGGRLVTPHVARGLVNANGDLQKEFEFPSRRVFSEVTTRAVLKLMETVVTDGSGKPARIPGYRIAGKTGTAQKALNGYYTNARITSFVGIVPVEAPRYVVLAVVDEPTRGVIFGSTVAAPIVKSVMEVLLVLEGVPPSSDPTVELAD